MSAVLHFPINMNKKKVFFISLAASLILACNGDDIFESLLKQSTPCFDVIHGEGCNTSLPEAYDPPYKGETTSPANTQVYLFTQKNQDKGEPIHKCGGKLPPKSDFDPNVDTVIIVAGGVESPCRVAWVREYRNQFFLRGPYNVILIDWTWGNYPDANSNNNGLVVAEQIAFVIKNIMIEKNMDGSKFHLIGHSAGTFIVAAVGKYIIEWNESKKLRRITHLDSPALFLKDKSDKRHVSPNDANFVDHIHSNAGDCFPIFLGSNHNSGHLDFYPNGGSVQTSCYSYAFESLLKSDFIYAFGSFLFPALCFHFQATQFFKVSINPPDGRLYIGVRCNSYEDFQSGACKRCCKEDFSNCAVAGMDAEYYYTPSKMNGNHSRYYFNTHDFCPFPEDYDFSIFKDCKDVKRK